MKRSGVILMGMTLWWNVPLFVVYLPTYSFRTHLRSYLLYLVVIGVALVFARVLSALDANMGWWNRCGYWGKYALLCGAYAVEMAAILVVLLLLDAYHILAYFGGDAGGSVGMFFLPSILVYLLAGALLGVVRAIYENWNRTPPS